MKSTVVALLATICFFVVANSKEAPEIERGYIFAIPRTLNKNATNNLMLTLFGVYASGIGTIRLLRADNDTILAELSERIDAGEGVRDIPIEFFVPDYTEYQARLQIRGEFEDGYEIFGEDVVEFNYQMLNSVIIFIQTDKPIYKPQQTVYIRVLPVDANLRPFRKRTLGNVWVEDQNGNRVAQWTNQTFGTAQYGIRKFKLPLSNEPILGTWNIYVSILGQQQSQSFRILEYILPKFDVQIKLPPYTLADARNIHFEVCAVYTYGKDVEGVVTLNISVENYAFENTEKYPYLIVREKIHGCFKYVLDVSLVDLNFTYYYRSIKVVAEVTEKGTGVKANTTGFIVRTQTPLYISFVDKYESYFKPNLPYYGKVKVTRPDNSAAPKERISICMTVTREHEVVKWWATRKVKYCRNYTSNADGLILFSISPQYTDTTGITLEAKSLKYLGESKPPLPTLYAPQASIFLTSWYSPSGSFLQIQGIEDPLPCDREQEIQILFTSYKTTILRLYYLIVSRGQISERKYIDVSFDVANDVSDREGNDIMKGANETQIVPNPDTKSQGNNQQCKALKKNVKMPFIGSASIPIDVKTSMSPAFYFLVYHVRNDREIVADSLQFTVEKCLQNKVTMKFSDESVQPGTATTLTVTASPNSLCGIKAVDKSVLLIDSTQQLTKDQIFERLSGLYNPQTYPRNHCDGKKQPGLQTLAERSFVPFPPIPIDYTFSPYADAITAYEKIGYLPISNFILLTRPCQTESYNRPPIFFAARGGFAGAALDVASKSESAIPGRPITQSAVDVRDFFPETWLFFLKNVGQKGELVQRKVLPHSITEWVGDAVCVNEEDGLGISDVARIRGYQDFFLSLTLPYSVIRGETLPVTVTVFSYVKKCLPISVEFRQTGGFDLLSDSAKIDICVCNGSESHRFHIRPNIIGKLNLTVSGTSDASSDACGSRDIFNSVARDALTNNLLVEPEGFPNEVVTSYFFFPQEDGGTFNERIPYILPKDVVEDSERGYFIATGNIFGPAIGNLNNLLQLPTGCGEQNIVAFIPNAYVLDYLTAAGQLTADTKNNAMRNLETGYQRELSFRLSDYSYSTFGPVDKEGSMILTAFVVRSFAQAERYIYIDRDGLQKSADWIISRQQEDGCFPAIGHTFTEALKGGVQTNSSAAVTAYVLMSLLTADLSKDTVTNKALACIESVDRVSPFEAALFAYTFALAGKKQKAEAYLKELYRTADTTGDTVFWHYQHMTVQIEIAAYAVLSNIEVGKPLSESVPIIRWLNMKRNGQGGFASSQDTVLGLQALSVFAIAMGNKPVNIRIDTRGILNEEILINTENQLLVRTYKVSTVPGELDVRATGTGGALIQAVVRCNTYKLQSETYFFLEVKAEGKDCPSVKIRVCTSYLPPGKKSNMALVEVKMLSGLSPDKDSLNQLKNIDSLAVRRVDVENNKVIFYFDELSNEKKCFSFTATRSFDVSDLKPAMAIVYDYYATERTQGTTYTVSNC